MKNLLKSFFNSGVMLALFWCCMFFIGKYAPRDPWSHVKPDMLQDFVNNPNDKAKILGDKGVYGHLAKHILIQKKLKGFSEGGFSVFVKSNLSSEDLNFLKYEIHGFPFFRDCMIYVLARIDRKYPNRGVREFADSCGLSRGWLNLKGHLLRRFIDVDMEDELKPFDSGDLQEPIDYA